MNFLSLSELIVICLHRVSNVIEFLLGNSIEAKVLRENREIDIFASEIVSGDVIILKAGDRIPADGRIFQGRIYSFMEELIF